MSEARRRWGLRLALALLAALALGLSAWVFGVEGWDKVRWRLRLLGQDAAQVKLLLEEAEAAGEPLESAIRAAWESRDERVRMVAAGLVEAADSHELTREGLADPSALVRFRLPIGRLPREERRELLRREDFVLRFGLLFFDLREMGLASGFDWRRDLAGLPAISVAQARSELEETLQPLPEGLAMPVSGWSLEDYLCDDEIFPKYSAESSALLCWMVKSLELKDERVRARIYGLLNSSDEDVRALAREAWRATGGDRGG